MKNISEIHSRNTVYPEKVLQFGEGNFLRAFADYLIDIMNQKNLFGGSVVICQPIEKGLCRLINEQNGLYTLILRGRENGEPVEKTRIVESVSRCINPYEDFSALLDVAKSSDLKVIISNTTEAGIAFSDRDKFHDAPPASYPAKLTRFLFERYSHFSGSDESKLLILPVELIENNGDELLKCVNMYADLWDLGADFKVWLNKCCFSNTLVDRIVTGYPAKEKDTICEKLGYNDNLLDTAEPFFFWALEAPESFRDVFPAHKSGLNAVFCDDISGYKKRKVRILNGAHTASVLGAYLAGYDIVRDMMNDSDFNKFIRDTLDSEIIPYIDLPENELRDFATAVFQRFNNPFIDHKLLDISLNSVSKFKARCLPSLIDCANDGKFPKHLLFSLACLIEFYHAKERNGEKYPVRDDESVLEFFNKAFENENYASLIMANTSFWGMNLCELEGAEEFVGRCCDMIRTSGVKSAMEFLK